MKNLFKILGISISIIMILIIFLYIKINKPYSEIININWSINLPSSYKEIYSIDSGKSFHGDGERYHIFQYSEKDNIDEYINWENTKNETIEKAIYKVLDNLNVSRDNMPNFKKNYKYYTKFKNDSSKIYLIFFSDTKRLYIIEDIY